MGSSSRSLQLKLMNCKALQGFNFFQKLSVYAVASLASDDPSNKQLAQQQRTPADTQGDKDPDWNNHEMFFDLGFGGRDGCEDDYDDHHFLHFDLRTELAVFGDKSLGEVHVLLKDLINQQEETSNEIVRFVSYEVRTSDKKPNGVLSFSYKVVHIHNDGGSTSCTGSQNCNLGMSDRGSPENKNGQIDGYNPIVNHVNGDLFDHHHSNPDEKAKAEVHCPSYFPSPYAHSPSLVMEDQYLQIPFGQSPGTPVAPHRIHYPSLETPHPGPAPARGGYLNHPRPDDRFHYLPPTPQPPPPPAGEGYLNHPRPDDRFHYLPPTPQPPPPPAAPVFLPPFPPPPPDHHHRQHHHHHHHHHHNGVGVAQGAAYQPMSTWGHDYQPYSKPLDPSKVGGNYIHAYPYN